ncbi:hypothetical protein WMF31_20905 [Sorangium sp. So ce1036]|uniref:hypothetical protein n=1 Tax=Sorangium sp. So ce1036 TaxID=3133328 RepID=UPI003F0D1732
MSRLSDATLRAQIPTALLIGGDAALLERCQAAAMDAGIIVKACPVSMAAALAEERRPVVIVVTPSTYALDPERFEEIARDVVSTVVRVDARLTDDELGMMLSTAARESRKQRARQLTPGRYSLVPGDEGASGPRSERWSVAASAPEVGGRPDPEATPLPRSGRRSAAELETAYRERVAAAVSGPQPGRWGADSMPPEARYRPHEAAVPRSGRPGGAAGPGAPRGGLPAPSVPLGVMSARRSPPGPPAPGGEGARRRDTPVAGTQPAVAPLRREWPAPGLQRAEQPWRRETPAPGSRRGEESPSGPGSQRGAAYAAGPGSQRGAAYGAGPGSQRGAAYAAGPGSQRGAAYGAGPGSQRGAEPLQREDLGPPPAATAMQGQVPASGVQEGEANGRRPTPPPSSHRAPPSSRRAQFHVDIALLFDERGLPRADPQAK